MRRLAIPAASRLWRHKLQRPLLQAGRAVSAKWCQHPLPCTVCRRRWASSFTYVPSPLQTLDESDGIEPAGITSIGQEIGFAGIRGLLTPADFAPMTQEAAKDIEELVRKCVANGPPTSAQDVKRVIACMDGISNAVCAVADVVAFCRAVHADEAWREAASTAAVRMDEIIIGLNSNPEIYACLAGGLDVAVELSRGFSGDASAGAAGADPQAPFSAEEMRMLRDLVHDMEDGGSGRNMSDTDAAHVAQLHANIANLKYLFTTAISNEDGWVVKVAASQADTVALALGQAPLSHEDNDQQEANDIATSSFYIPKASWPAVLHRIEDRATRHDIYCQVENVAPGNNDVVLDALSVQCWTLAKQLGRESYSDLQLRRLMLNSRSDVNDVLAAMAENLREGAKHDLAELVGREDVTHGSIIAQESAPISSADFEFLAARSKGPGGALYIPAPNNLCAYLTLDGVVEALSGLCKDVFGVHLEAVPVREHESWVSGGSSRQLGSSGQLLKFSLVENQRDDGDVLVLGDLYLDLAPRPNKPVGAAQHTLQCGRALANDILIDQPSVFCIDGAAAKAGMVRPGIAGMSSFDGGDSLSHPSRVASLQQGLGYQRPVVALVLDCESLTRPHDPHVDAQSLLNLFHEFGHAVHSLMSRSRFHHLSGSRTPTDFCEIPSQLFEKFVADPRFLRTYLRHSETGEPPTSDVVEYICGYWRGTRALAALQQVVLSQFDQCVFGPAPPFPKHLQKAQLIEQGVSVPDEVLQACGMVETQQALQAQVVNSLPQPGPNPWRRASLASYSGTYHSYIVADFAAQALWDKLFAPSSRNPADGDRLLDDFYRQEDARKAGEALRYGLLQPGNGRDPRQTLFRTLGLSGNKADEGAFAFAGLIRDAARNTCPTK